jgi:hypothetical protein
VKTIDCYDRDDNYLSSEEEDSYITDKYHSLKDLDDIIHMRENEGVQQDEKDAVHPPQDIENSPEEKNLRING